MDIISEPPCNYVQLCQKTVVICVGMWKTYLHHSDIQYVSLWCRYALCVSMCRYIQFQSTNTCTYMQYIHIQTYLHIPAIQAHTYNTCNSDIPSHTCNTWSYLHICRYLHTCNTYKFLQIPAYTGRYLLPYYIPTTITIYLQHTYTYIQYMHIPTFQIPTNT